MQAEELDVAPDPELSLGERLAVTRRRAGYDQMQMAELLGVSRPLISKWERGKSVPDVQQAARWADITRTSFGWLCGISPRSRCFSLVPGLAGQMELPLGVARQLAAV